MKLDLGFDVAAPIDAVWPALNDLESVGPCLPGAKITGREDGTYHGEFTLRVGPFAAVHQGTVRIEDADEDARVQRLSVGGAPGNGSSATIVNTLTETDGGTRVDAVAELTAGRAARRLRRQRRDRGRRQPPAARLRHLPGRAPERAAGADGCRRDGRQGRARGAAGRGPRPPDPESTGG